MSRVFVPQVPSRFDRSMGAWVPTISLEHAAKFGDVVVMLPPEASRLATVPISRALREKMRDFGPEDFIVAVGDPSVLAMAAVLAHKTVGKLRLLKWDRVMSEYILMEIEL